jgi:hypothetical protein
VTGGDVLGQRTYRASRIIPPIRRMDGTESDFCGRHRRSHIQSELGDTFIDQAVVEKLAELD